MSGSLIVLAFIAISLLMAELSTVNTNAPIYTKKWRLVKSGHGRALLTPIFRHTTM